LPKRNRNFNSRTKLCTDLLIDRHYRLRQPGCAIVN
jgi:hypothetical protein